MKKFHFPHLSRLDIFMLLCYSSEISLLVAEVLTVSPSSSSLYCILDMDGTLGKGKCC